METGNKMVVTFDNLENAVVQKNDTVERLVISNASLSDSLAARNTDIACLLTVITNISMGGGSGGGGRSGTNNKKTTKPTWDPTGYCWTHGYKIRANHSSETCTKHKDGNDAHLTAKRGDIQGGCEWNITWNPREN